MEPIESDVGDVLDVRGPSDFHVMDGGDHFLILPLDAASGNHGFPQSRQDEIDQGELPLLLLPLLLVVLLSHGRFRALAGAAAAPRHHHHPSHGFACLLTYPPLSLSRMFGLGVGGVCFSLQREKWGRFFVFIEEAAAAAFKEGEEKRWGFFKFEVVMVFIYTVYSNGHSFQILSFLHFSCFYYLSLSLLFLLFLFYFFLFVFLPIFVFRYISSLPLGNSNDILFIEKKKFTFISSR